MEDSMSTSLHIRIEDDLRTQAQLVAESMGFDLPSLVRAFLTQMVRENRLPYHPTGDPFFSKENQQHLEKAYADARLGKNCFLHDLLEDDD